MTVGDNKAIVERYFRELDAGNAAAASSLFTTDCRIYRPEEAAPLIGNGEIHRIVSRTHRLYASFETDIHYILGEGDKVAVRLSHRAVGRGKWETRIGTFDCTGKRTGWDAIVLFVLRDGKITDEYVMRDELGMLLSVGALRRVP